MASSSRKLGKGRVLGAGKPMTSQPTSIPDHVRKPSLLSPSESSISLNSQHSDSKSSNGDTDISAAVAQQARENVAAASAGSRMVCPICSEEMVTLLQLNRHLDDAHKDIQDEEQDEIQTWFKTQMVKAKKFQPLAVLNQKLKGLDVFEENDDRRPVSTAATAKTHTSEPIRIVPEEFVTKEHWQNYTRDGLCSDPICGHRLGGTNGNVNCRHCGKLFCEEHTMYQMKLSRSAQHEPIRGYWSRVCETCYKSRAGYNDHSGLLRDHTNEFALLRRKAVDKSYLEVGRLEKRLSKLTQLLAAPDIDADQGAVGYIWSISGQKSRRRQAEESVVDWQDDAEVAQCPFCQQEFTSYTFKRHHCRLCGRVVCSDPITGCSMEVGLNVDASPNNGKEKDTMQVPIDVRMCKDCNHTIFSKADFLRQLNTDPADQRAYQNLKQFERGIRMMLPRFQRLLSALQDPNKPPTPAQLTEATKVRKRLTDSFTQYDVAARRIRDLPTQSPTQAKLQKAVYGSAATFLHIHMLPLKSLPKILKHASPHDSSTANGHLSPAANGRGPRAAIKRGGHSASPSRDDSSQLSASSRLSTLETEEKQLRDELIVLEEQRFMVGEMVADAQRRRKFEEVESLGKNLEDLSREVDRVQGMLESVRSQFEGVYIGADVG